MKLFKGAKGAMNSCALCNLPKNRQALIESEYIRGTLDANGVVAQLISEGRQVDTIAVLEHFDEHDDRLGEQSEEKRAFLKDPPRKNGRIPEAHPKQEEEESSFEMPDLKKGEDGDHLSELQDILRMLKARLFTLAQGKDVRSLGVMTKEIRETLKEIERVKKATRASMADRTESLMGEHNELNRFLLYNLCVECGEKHRLFLEGKFTTFAVDAHGRQDGVHDRTDAVDSGPVE